MRPDPLQASKPDQGNFRLGVIPPLLWRRKPTFLAGDPTVQLSSVVLTSAVPVFPEGSEAFIVFTVTGNAVLWQSVKLKSL